MDKLVRRAQKGHDAAFLTLFQQYEAYIYRMAYVYVQNENDALDIVQETAYRAFKSIRLKDGTAMTFKLLKGGYVYYGFMDVYFEVDEQVFNETWHLLK